MWRGWMRMTGGVGLGVCGLAGVAAGGPITVSNNSFESPNAGFASPTSDNWSPNGGNNTGQFTNLAADTPVDVGGGQTVLAKRITNADGNQLAYIAANTPASGAYEFSQYLVSPLPPASYLPGQSYTLSVGIAVSSVQPPDAGSKITIELYYLDTGGARQPVALTPIVNDTPTGLRNDFLKYFTAQTPVVAANALYANKPIGILLTTAGNSTTTGGTFDMDNVTLTSVPEPSSAAVGGLVTAAGGALLRRRRPA